jgi:hypothetical protein
MRKLLQVLRGDLVRKGHGNSRRAATIVQYEFMTSKSKLDQINSV